MTLLIILGIIVILGIMVVSMYNSLIKLRNNRENAFADIDVQLKQRLICTTIGRYHKRLRHPRKRDIRPGDTGS